MAGSVVGIAVGGRGVAVSLGRLVTVGQVAVTGGAVVDTATVGEGVDVLSRVGVVVEAATVGERVLVRSAVAVSVNGIPTVGEVPVELVFNLPNSSLINVYNSSKSTSHVRTVRSGLAEKIHLPSGLKVAQCTSAW